MKYSQKLLTLKGYSATSMFLGQPGICNLPRRIFILSSIGFLDASPVGILFPGLTQENIFPGESSSSTGVLRQGVINGREVRY